MWREHSTTSGRARTPKLTFPGAAGAKTPIGRRGPTCYPDSENKGRAMTATGTSKSTPRGTEPMAIVGEEALSPLTEAWIERMMRGAERMHSDELTD